MWNPLYKDVVASDWVYSKLGFSLLAEFRIQLQNFSGDEVAYETKNLDLVASH